jgi:hypothetical protein
VRELEVDMKRPVPVESAAASIDEKVKELGDWRGKTLAKVETMKRCQVPFSFPKMNV